MDAVASHVRPVQRYAVAVASVALAWLARAALDPALGEAAPFLLFIVATVAAAWYGGLLPAVVATLLGGLVGLWAFVMPRGDFALQHLSDGQWVHLAVYLVAGLGFGLIAGERDVFANRARRTRERLEDSEERFRAAFQTAGVGMAQTDPHGRCIALNDRLAQILGRRHDELRGHLLHELVEPDDRGGYMQRRRQLLEDGVAVLTSELRCRRGDGRIVWVRATESVVRDPAGEPKYLVLVLEDITDARTSQEALRALNETLEQRVAERTAAAEERARQLAESEHAVRESEQRFHQMASTVPVVFWLATPDLTELSYISPAFERIWGRPRESLYQDPKRLLEWVHPEDVERVREARLAWVQAPGRDHYEQTYRIVRPDAVRWVLDRGYVIRDERGEVTRCCGVAEDITLQREVEQEVDAYQQRLRSLASDLTLTEQRERRRMAEGLHDHLGQLLATVKFMLGALRVSFAEGKPAEILAKADDILGQAIQYTRTVTFELAPPVLYELGLEPALSWLAQQIGQRHEIAVDFSSDDGRDPAAEDVRVLLFEAVREVLSNMVRHSRATRARVAMRRGGDKVRITIEDNGVGFDLAALQPKPDRPGGFGLFNIRERLDLVGGRLEVHSTPGKGTRIVLVAPLGEPSPPRPIEQATEVGQR